MDQSWEPFFRYALASGNRMIGWRKAADDEPDFAGKYLVAEYETVAPSIYAVCRLWQFDAPEQALIKLNDLLA